MRGLQGGFTLIELISVIVILGIVGAIGSNFLVSTVDAYRITETRTKLLARGRTSVEQMTRQIRLAVPNSLRVSASGRCIEFLPLVAGANYLNELPDSENGASTISSITTSPFIVDVGSPQHAIVGGLAVSDIYSVSSTAARASIASLNGNPATLVNLSGNHRFIRNSINQRIFVADNPKRFCASADALLQLHSYTFDVGTLSDANPGGVTIVMSHGVQPAATAFQLSPGSEDRNATVGISLAFSGNGESVVLNQTVLVRNVP